MFLPDIITDPKHFCPMFPSQPSVECVFLCCVTIIEFLVCLSLDYVWTQSSNSVFLSPATIAAAIYYIIMNRQRRSALWKSEFFFQFLFLLNHFLISVLSNISWGSFSIISLRSCSRKLVFAKVLGVCNIFTQKPNQATRLHVKQWPPGHRML